MREITGIHGTYKYDETSAPIGEGGFGVVYRGYGKVRNNSNQNQT